MSRKYSLGTILKSIDKNKLYIVTSCKDIDCPCEGCAFSDVDCYARIPKELGIAMGQDCADIFGEYAVLKVIEGGV